MGIEPTSEAWEACNLSYAQNSALWLRSELRRPQTFVSFRLIVPACVLPMGVSVGTACLAVHRKLCMIVCQQRRAVGMTGANPLTPSVMDRKRSINRWKIPFSS